MASAPSSPAHQLLLRGASGLEATHSITSDWAPSSHASTPSRPRYYARPGYSFGVSYICDQSQSGISALAFASVRSDLVAVANQEGELFILQLAPSASSTPSKHVGPDQPQQQSHQGEPSVLKCSKIHALSITAIDWSFDNSQIFSVGSDGGMCFFEAATGDCIRSIATRVPITCCRLHKAIPNLSFIGTVQGSVEVHNCSSGTLHSKLKLPGATGANTSASLPPAAPSAPAHSPAGPSKLFFRPPLAQRPAPGIEVTSIEVSNHHLFIGDSTGNLHLYRLDRKHDGQLNKMISCMKLKVPLGISPAAITRIEFVPFCRTTDTPILLCTCSDGTLAIIRVLEKQNKLELHVHSSCNQLDLCPAVVCPLSSIQDIPRLVTGSSDGNVYVMDLSSGSKSVVVSTLRGHRAPLKTVGLSYDENVLASGDKDGQVIIWKKVLT